MFHLYVSAFWLINAKKSKEIQRIETAFRRCLTGAGVLPHVNAVILGSRLLWLRPLTVCVYVGVCVTALLSAHLLYRSPERPGEHAGMGWRAEIPLPPPNYRPMLAHTTERVRGKQKKGCLWLSPSSIPLNSKTTCMWLSVFVLLRNEQIAWKSRAAAVLMIRMLECFYSQCSDRKWQIFWFKKCHFQPISPQSIEM